LVIAVRTRIGFVPFPTLPLAAIYKVIAFHLENQTARNEYVEKCHEEVRQ